MHYAETSIEHTDGVNHRMMSHKYTYISFEMFVNKSVMLSLNLNP